MYKENPIQLGYVSDRFIELNDRVESLKEKLYKST